MTFLGKIIGFFLGYLVLGPIGALIGFFIGTLFDKGLKLHTREIPRSHSAEIQRAFFTSTFLVMGYLAKADGRVSQDEIRAAENIMKRLELDDSLRQEAISLFTAGKNAQFDFEESLTNLYQHCHRHPELLRFFIEIQLEAAVADGALQPAEQQLILHMCRLLHISPREFQQLWARQWASTAFHQWYTQFERGHWSDQAETGQRYYQQRTGTRRESTAHSLQGAYGVLGVSEQASVAEIKKAYRRLMNQHHPDKLASRGLPDSMLKLAKEKTQEIRAAYDLIRQARGFK